MEREESFHNIHDLYETNRVGEARTFLALGWRLLQVVPKCDEGHYPCYILGWPNAVPAQYPTQDHYFTTAVVAPYGCANQRPMP